ncbi:hypothetical protein M569_03232 [Genlisea aurea]|uniref:Transcription factor CBF/NF-Y/archaeal histone domain-containing protein n=1 Tax=Genlisea aurea TaxID=192259 RepID=S8E6Q3_9LAMI|nr:hypothetical protein M569_03232 [Genlisea aurea]
MKRKREDNTTSSTNEEEEDQQIPFAETPSPIDANDNNNNSNGGGRATNSSSKEQDRFLPIANVGRIMKKVIPGNGKISKDAKETVQECVSEFISFVTGEASDKCQREKRKTINGDDILWAIMTLGFEDYVNPLKIYLTKYRDLEGEKLNLPKQHQQQQQQQQRMMMLQQHDQNSLGMAGVYSSQPSFLVNDHQQQFPPIRFSQNSTFQLSLLPHQDHVDDHL